MNDEPNKNEPAHGLAAFAEFLYNDLPFFIQETFDVISYPEVRDVYAAVRADKAKLIVTAGDEVISQTFDPGTYIIIQLDGIQAIRNAAPGFYGFPITDSEIPEDE